MPVSGLFVNKPQISSSNQDLGINRFRFFLSGSTSIQMVSSGHFGRGASSIFRWTTALVCLVVLVGCKREGIRVYLAPKDLSGPAQLRYKVPQGWTELEPGAMRTARFSVPSKTGDMDVSIIALPEIKADKLDIVNLWREQVHLPAASEQEVAGMTETVSIAGRPADLFDMVSTESLIQEKYPARILVAMIRQGNATWFIKMTGEDESVREQKPVFVEFLKSMTFDHSAQETPAAFTANRPRSAPSTANPQTSAPNWQVPPHWKEVEATEMLLAKFIVPGQGDEKAEVTVSVFPGNVGGTHAIINRWRKQIGLAELDEQGTASLAQPLDGGPTNAILVDMSGAQTRVISAIVPDGGRTWFYKLMGPPGVAETEKIAFIAFINSALRGNSG
jgi:hypothetical protein